VVIIEFVSIAELFKDVKEGEVISIRGWVYRIRRLKDKIFFLLRDSSGIIQCVVAKENKKVWKSAEALTLESSVCILGKLKYDERAPGGREVHVTSMEVMQYAEPFPITEDAVKSESDYLLDVRHLWMRSSYMTAILKVRSTVFEAIHEYFRRNGYYEVQAPMFITAAVEGGATLFEVNYFGRKGVYLTQSSQFYLEALIFALEKVYTIAPSFRAEKSRSRRHLSEFWHAEAEAAWYSLKDILKVEEELISHIVKKVIDEREKELKVLKRDVDLLLKESEPPFYRISYDEAVNILRKDGFEVEWGDDFGADEERALVMKFDKPVFIIGFPEKCKAFYHRNDPERPEVTLSADLLAPEGYGEIIGGGERIYDKEELIRKIKRFGLKPEDYEWYIDLRRYGSVPHSGFGLGVDRTVMWICGLKHIRDAIPFPRDIRRVYP